MAQQQDALARFTERYLNGQVPWDDPLPPPEVRALTDALVPGHALDLGCGYGRTAIYLAHQGWQVDAIDFVPQAIEEAQHRAMAAGVIQNVQFHNASVANLSFLDFPSRYDLAVDIGCMHALSEPLQHAYKDELRRLLRQNARYLLFARLQEPGPKMPEPEGEESGEERFLGLAEEDLWTLFAEFQLDRSEFGVTEGSDYRWRSGWFWFRR